MSQLNLRVSREFEASLGRFMRLRRIASKSEAIRIAVAEAVERLDRTCHADYRAWVGAALAAPLNPSPRFRSHDELW